MGLIYGIFFQLVTLHSLLLTTNGKLLLAFAYPLQRHLFDLINVCHTYLRLSF